MTVTRREARRQGETRGAVLASQAAASDKLRMLLCYFGTHKEKLDGLDALAEYVLHPAAARSPLRECHNSTMQSQHI